MTAPQGRPHFHQTPPDSPVSTLEVAGEVVGEGDEDGSEVGVEWVAELDQALPGRQSQDFHCS